MKYLTLSFISGPSLPAHDCSSRIRKKRGNNTCASYIRTDGLDVDFRVPSRQGSFGSVYFGNYLINEADTFPIVIKCPVESELGRKLFDMERYTNEKLARYAHTPRRIADYLGQVILPREAEVPGELARIGLMWRFEGRGETLEDYLSQWRIPELAYALRTSPSATPLRRELSGVILRELLAILADFQRAGIVHRDVKPANLLVVPGETDAPLKSIDFGSSCDWGSLLKRGLGLATCDPVYTAPERKLELMRPNAAEKFDVYSVGLVALRCALPSLTGEKDMEWFVQNVLAKSRFCLLRACNSVLSGYISVPQNIIGDIRALDSPANEDLLSMLATMLAENPAARANVASCLQSRFMMSVPVAARM